MENLSFDSTLAGKIVGKIGKENRDVVFKETKTEYFSERVINSYMYNNNNIATLSNIKNNNPNYFLELANEKFDDGKFDEKTLYCFYTLSEREIGLAYNPKYNKGEYGKETVTFKAIGEYGETKYTYEFNKIDNNTVDYSKVELTTNDKIKSTLTLFKNHRLVTINNNGDYSFNYSIKDVKSIEEVNDTYYLNTVKYIFNSIATDNLPNFKNAVSSKNLKYIGFYFTSPNEKKAQRLLFSIDEFSNSKKYFYTTIFSWAKNTTGTTVTCEYTKLEEKDGKVKLNINYGAEGVVLPDDATPIKTYAAVSYSIPTILKKEDVKNAVIGFLIDDKAINVKTDDYWADQLAETNKKIGFLEDSYQNFYYKITYKGGNKTFTKLTYRNPDIFNIARNSNLSLEDFQFQCGNFKENEEVDAGQRLYSITLFNVKKFNIKATADGKIECKGSFDSLENESRLQGDWKSPMSAKGIRQLKQYEGWTPHFYCNDKGIISIGYGHTHSPGYNVEKEADEAALWTNLKIHLSKTTDDAGAKFKPENGQWKLVKNNANSETITTKDFIYNNLNYKITIDESLGTKLLNRDIKTKACETFGWILRKFLTTQEAESYNYNKNDRSITTAQKLLNNVLHSTKGSSDFIQKLTQTQFDDLVYIMFQGSADYLGNYIINNGYQGGSYEKICGGIVKCVEEQIGKTEFKNDSFRRKLIKDFTVSSSSIEKAEENKPKTETNIEEIKIEAFAEEKMTIVSKLKLGNINILDKGILDPLIIDDNDRAVYYVNVEKIEEDSSDVEDVEGVEKLDTEEKVNWEEVKKFVNKWSFNYTANQNITNQTVRDVKNYYDFYSGMTPFVEIYFRDNYYEEVKDEAGNVKETKLRWNVINSIDHPYIKSLKVEDKGVKKAHIQLFDKDFASYQFGILKPFDTNSTEKVVYSLDTLIKRSLMMPESKNEEQKKETYNEQNRDSQDLQEEYLKISEYNETMGPGNLRIRFGYCDDNQKIPKDDNNDKIYEYFKTNYDLENENLGKDVRRTNRWWDVKANKSEDASVFNWEHKINNDKLDSGKTELFTQPAEIVAVDDSKTIVADAKKRNSTNSTTKMSYLNEYMIVGYKTSLKPNGILYDIDAIEVKNVEVMRKRFLQRYAEVTTYPLEILYILMHVFNENNDGKIIKSGIKLLFMNEDNDFNDNPANGFNMNFDFSNLKKEDIALLADVQDKVYAYKKGGGVVFDEYLKKATLSFGGETALSNYSNSAEKKPSVYKSVESLMNEFCALCPSKKDYSEEEPKKATDRDGNEIKTDNKSSVSSLTWLTAKSKDDKDKNIYIIFYYKKIRKQQCIKRYIWGPANPYKSIVKDLQIENNNEFAMMSSVTSSSFDGSGNVILTSKENISNSNGASNQEMEEVANTVNTREKLKAGDGFSTDYIAGTIEQSDKINTALANCMYSGTMTILGDPAMEFNLEIQPYTYPIYIEVLVPINDAFWDKEINDKFKEYNKIYHGIRIANGSNQKVHEMSGFYVITSIEHNISTSGYTTILGVSRYPNIEKDVLKKESLDKYRSGALIT